MNVLAQLQDGGWLKASGGIPAAALMPNDSGLTALPRVRLSRQPKPDRSRTSTAAGRRCEQHASSRGSVSGETEEGYLAPSGADVRRAHHGRRSRASAWGESTW